jgi:pyrroloquinoline quinone biosynthesis protein B
MLHFRLLGTAAGGGFPQWNCACSLCVSSRAEPETVSPRLQLQAAVWNSPDAIFLLNASPDLRFQIEANAELRPRTDRGNRNTPIQGIVLTTADLDQVLGLLLLREFQPMTVYATALVRRVLEANSFFRMLERVPNQLTWVDIQTGVSFPLGTSDIVCTPFAMAGELPFYAKELGPSRPEQASLGLFLEGDGTRIAYTPAVPAITDSLRTIYARCQTIFVDGTFWSDEELSKTHAGTPTARAIGHVPMSGKDGTIALLSDLPALQRVFVHLNNTNPVLDPRSGAYNEVVEAGWKIGQDGWELGQ